MGLVAGGLRLVGRLTAWLMIAAFVLVGGLFIFAIVALVGFPSDGTGSLCPFIDAVVLLGLSSVALVVLVVLAVTRGALKAGLALYRAPRLP